MSKIKKDIKKDINLQSIETQKKNIKKDILWVVKNIFLFVTLQFLGQILYALCFTLSISEATQNMEIFQNILFSSTVVNKAYYFGHFFVLLYLVMKAVANANANNTLGKSFLDKLSIEIECAPLKNAFHGINYFAAGLTMQSVLTTITSLIGILIIGREISSIETYFSISQWSLLVIGICMPVAEELMFRGKIMQRLTKTLDEKKANRIQALCYAIIHGFSAYAISDFIMGLAFGKMKQMSKSIVAPLLAHIGANALNALIFTFPYLLSYRIFSIAYSIVLIYGAGVLLFVLFKAVWDHTKK